MMMALGDPTMSLKVTVAASIRVFISMFTASLISAMRACVAKGSQRLTKRMAVCSSGTGALQAPHGCRPQAGGLLERSVAVWAAASQGVFSTMLARAATSSSFSLSAR